jgi:hypothetical protein
MQWKEKHNWCADPLEKSSIEGNIEIITKYVYKRGMVIVTGEEIEKERKTEIGLR